MACRSGSILLPIRRLEAAATYVEAIAALMSPPGAEAASAMLRLSLQWRTAMMLRMATISEAWAEALAHYDGGGVAEADQICRQILAVEPNHVDAWHLLGGIALQAGQRELAIQYLRR